VRTRKKTGKGMGKGRDAYKYGKNHLIGSGSDGLGKSATSCQDTYDLISKFIMPWAISTAAIADHISHASICPVPFHHPALPFFDCILQKDVPL
jgi:hypothetical protein